MWLFKCPEKSGCWLLWIMDAQLYCFVVEIRKCRPRRCNANSIESIHTNVIDIMEIFLLFYSHIFQRVMLFIVLRFHDVRIRFKPRSTECKNSIGRRQGTKTNRLLTNCVARSLWNWLSSNRIPEYKAMPFNTLKIITLHYLGRYVVIRTSSNGFLFFLRLVCCRRGKDRYFPISNY